jgi:elongation factor 1-alpha
MCTFQIRFRYCIDNIALLAKKVGFAVETVPFIPISGWEGDNLITPSSKMPWFSSWKVKRRSGGASGRTLLDAIDSSETPFRMFDRPLRVPIHTVYKLGGKYTALFTKGNHFVLVARQRNVSF